jgi:hypothetical protein
VSLRIFKSTRCWRLLFLLLLFPASLHGADWIRAGVNTNQPIWGVRGGLLWAVSPGGFRPRGEPRGLIRLGYPILTNGTCDLVNFIAVEPIVKGRKGFSELEESSLDGRRGKRLWATSDHNASTNDTLLVPGKISSLSSGVERLEVTVRVEPFDNGAKVRLIISQESNTPDEIRLAIHAESDSAPMEYCILTATMGNMARTRQLWLKDEVIQSRKLYPNHQGDEFAPHTIYSVDRLPRDAQGDILMAVTTDEEDPASVFPFPGTRRWHYGGFTVTQYWKKVHGTFHEDLHAAVNARATYWQTRQLIPGGVAFENFELREKFYEGQQFIFGITRRSPTELGIVQTAKPSR